MSEQDLFPEWNGGVVKMEIMANLSVNRKVVYNQRKLPFPLDNREAYNCWSRSFLTGERKGILFISRALSEKREQFYGVKARAVAKGLVRGEMVKSINMLEQIDDKSCWIYGYICFDPKLTYMPDFLMNFITKTNVTKLVERMQSKEVFENKAVKQRYAERKEVNDDIIRRINE